MNLAFTDDRFQEYKFHSLAVQPVMSNEKYFSASAKHLYDAELLLANSRPDNAAYLSGYVAECALKGLLHAQHGLASKGFGHDLTALSRAATILAVSLSPLATRYSLPAGSDETALRISWHPELRYRGEGSVPVSTTQAWIRAAKSFYQEIVVPMRLDGLTDSL